MSDAWLVLLVVVVFVDPTTTFLFPGSSCNSCSCPAQACPSLPSCPPIAACPAPPPPVQTCCSSCGGCKQKQKQLRRVKRSPMVISNATFIVEHDKTLQENNRLKRESQSEELDANKCNSPALQQIIIENIDRVTSVAKKRMQNAAETAFGARYNVICARGDFSYIANTEEYCQQTVGDVTCFLFKQLSDVVRARI